MAHHSSPVFFAVTMGDAAGIGPEIVAKALSDPAMPQGAIPIVIGEAKTLQERIDWLGLKTKVCPLSQWPTGPAQAGEIWVLEAGTLNRAGFAWGKPHGGAGELAYQSIVTAVRLAKEGRVRALVTAPICKESLHLAGHKYDGHTGLIAELCGCRRYRMTFCTLDWRIIHVTAHLALSQALEQITVERVLESLQIGWEHLIQLKIHAPRIAVCGLNPHAGEAGIFGREEIEIIQPAMDRARALGIACEGPFAPDTIFLKAFQGEYDLVVAQYHDQGHIPGKLAAFDRGVNVTLGLPIIRTSVDHGTAFDIVKKGRADHRNFFHAYRYALGMANLLE